MAVRRAGNGAENYKSPARGITARSQPAWSETGTGEDEVAGGDRLEAAQPLAHLWFMKRKRQRSAGRTPLAQPQDGFRHRCLLGIAARQSTIEFADGRPFLEVLAGSLIKTGSPLSDVRGQRRVVFRGIHGQ